MDPMTRIPAWETYRRGTFGPVKVRAERAIVDGRVQAVKIEISAPSGISTEDLRSIRLGRILDIEGSETMMRALVANRSGRASPAMQDEAESLLRKYALVEEGPRPGRKPKGLAHYRRVAEVYQAASEAGRPPVNAVMREFGAKKGTAAKWIHLCRYEYGLLPPTTRGRQRAGGSTTTKARKS